MIADTLLYLVLASSLASPALYAAGKLMAVRVASWIGIASFIALAALLLAGLKPQTLALVRHTTATASVLLFAGIAAALVMYVLDERSLEWGSSPALHSLVPLTLFGLYLVSGAEDPLMVLASWLLVSIISYVLVALPDDVASRAAAVRYSMVGSLATVFLGAWAALVDEPGPGHALPGDKATAMLALSLLLAGLGFKLALFPFHWWLPSVYGRADGRVVGLVAGVVKLGFIVLLARLVEFYSTTTPQHSTLIAASLATLSAATMTYGNLAAMMAPDLRSMMAYSSIAQTGYIVAAMAAMAYLAPRSPEASELAMAAIVLQSIAYSLAKAPLFALTSEANEFDSVKGLGLRSGAAGASAVLLLASLLGIPPLLGFWGKLYLFLTAAKYSVPLLVAALVNSGVSSAYYIRVARMMASEGSSTSGTPLSREVKTALVVAAGITIVFGLAAPVVVRALVS